MYSIGCIDMIAFFNGEKEYGVRTLPVIETREEAEIKKSEIEANFVRDGYLIPDDYFVYIEEN